MHQAAPRQERRGKMLPRTVLSQPSSPALHPPQSVLDLIVKGTSPCPAIAPCLPPLWLGSPETPFSEMLQARPESGS